MQRSPSGFLASAVVRFVNDRIVAVSGSVIFADACILACVAYDTAKRRRLHPVFAWGLRPRDRWGAFCGSVAARDHAGRADRESLTRGLFLQVSPQQ